MKIKKSINLLFVGSYGQYNLGDDAMMVALIDGLRDRGHEVNATGLSRHVSKVEKYYQRYNFKIINNLDHNTKKESIGRRLKGLNAYDNTQHLYTIIESINNADVVILGGGNSFLDLHIQLFSCPLSYFRIIFTLARFFRKKILFSGISVDPVNSSIGRETVHYLCDLADFVILRDSKSRKILEEYEIFLTDNKYVTLPDAAVGLKMSKNLPDNLSDMFNRNSETKEIIGVCLRSLYWKWDEKEHEKLYHMMAKSLDEIVARRNANLIFIPGQLYNIDLNLQDDRYISKQVISFMKYKHRCIIIKEYLSVYDNLNVYNNCDFVIAMRHHSVVFSSIVKTPVLAIAYSPKFQYSIDLGLNDYLIPINSITSDKIVRYFMTLTENKDKIVQLLDTKQIENLSRWEEYINIIENLSQSNV